MPEPLKNLYNKTYIDGLCHSLLTEYPAFKNHAFKKSIFNKDWDTMTLKARMYHISACLKKFLPSNYDESFTILMRVAPGFSGFEAMFFPGFIEKYGLHQFDQSMNALEILTPFSSSEFAVRPFIIKYPEASLSKLKKWAISDNYHIRRLASEGCRPRLPWACALPDFKNNPLPIISILELLKSDPELFVRKSVANNLNDISKDHPEMINEIAKKWMGKNKRTDWIIKHGCRSLLKSGNTKTLKLLGYESEHAITCDNMLIQNCVEIGDILEFSFDLSTKTKSLGQIRLEYIINHVKKSGKTTPKCFKISEGSYPASEKSISKKHSFKKITTRQYYGGVHQLSVVVNGKSIEQRSFLLKSPNTWQVYILLCSDNSYYTGISTNVFDRFQKHATQTGAKYFRGRKPKQLIYLECEHNKSSASKREAEIKKLSRQEKLKLIEKNPIEAFII